MLGLDHSTRKTVTGSHVNSMSSADRSSRSMNPSRSTARNKRNKGNESTHDVQSQTLHGADGSGAREDALSSGPTQEATRGRSWRDTLTTSPRGQDPPRICARVRSVPYIWQHGGVRPGQCLTRLFEATSQNLFQGNILRLQPEYSHSRGPHMPGLPLV